MKNFKLFLLSILKNVGNINFYILMLLTIFIELIIFGILVLIISKMFPDIANITVWIVLAIVFIITPIFLILGMSYRVYKKINQNK